MPYYSDSEGPLCINDNAFELAGEFIPDGERLFTQLSRYDDYLVDVVVRPDYQAGDTLRLVLPFMLAAGVTDQALREYSASSVVWVSGAPEALRQIQELMPLFIITTSYEQFAHTIYRDLVPREHIYCTRLPVDKYRLSLAEAKRLKGLGREIVSLPAFPSPAEIIALRTAGVTIEAAERLNSIIWEELPKLECAGKLLEQIKVMGGERKAEAIAGSLQALGKDVSSAVFVGDSITDVEAFKLVRSGGGLALAFNGNTYALAAAEFACISHGAAKMVKIASVFADRKFAGLIGRQRVIEAAPECGVRLITPINREQLEAESQRMRKLLRGDKAGNLG